MRLLPAVSARRRRLSSVSAEPLESRRLLAATPTLIRDVNQTTDMLDPSNMAAVGSVAYFAGRAAVGDGYELFKTDGTAAGTVLVKDIRPGVGGSDPAELTNVNDTLYFAATDAAGDRELYKSDGTAAGTVRVADVSPTSSSQPAKLRAVGSHLYFATANGTTAGRLHRSDGTAAGTVPVNQPSGASITAVGSITPFNGGGLVSAGGGATSLYHVQNGVITGTLRGYEMQGLRVLGSTAYFISGNGTGNPLATGVVPSSLYRTDGTPAGTSLVKTLPGTRPQIAGVSAASGGLWYFSFSTSTTPNELWRTDGTDAGTSVLMSGGGISGGSHTPFGDHSVLFVRSTPGTGAEPWASDGTPEGTVPLTELTPGPGDGVIPGLKGLAFGGDVYYTSKPEFFPSTNANSDGRLWRSDGSAAGTTVVRDFSADRSNVAPLGVVNGAMLLNIGRQIGGGELYRSDGTDAGTMRVGATTPGNGSGMWYSQPTLNGTPTDLQDSPAFATGGGYTYYAASDGVSGKELWRTHTATGVTDRPGEIADGLDGSDPSYLTVVPDGTLYFAATSAAHGRELFRLRPGAAAADRLSDVVPGPGGSSVSNLQAVGGVLYFRADTTGTGYDMALWRHDPASGLTTQVRNGRGEPLVFPTRLTAAGTASYFRAYAIDASGTAPRGLELYRIDGANPAAAPQLFSEFIPGAASVGFAPVGAIGNTLFYHASDPAHGAELWRTDGTPEGTALVADITAGTAHTAFGQSSGGEQATVVAGGVLYFAAGRSGETNNSLWRTDGTTAGTYPVGQIPNPRSFVAAGGQAYVVSGGSIYRTDGSDADGALQLTQPGTGETSFRPGPLHVAGGQVYTVNLAGAGTGTRYELWRTTGAATGAGAAFERVASLGPRVLTPAGSELDNFFGQGAFAFASDARHLYFPMYTPAVGLEPHRLALFDPVAAVTGVYVKGTGWTNAFLSHLQQAGLGDAALGYAVDPADALNELPWTNLNQVSVRFSRGVNVTQSNLVVTGAAVASHATSAFAYDPATFTATWTLATAGVGAEKLALNLAGVTDAVTGAALDGEWPGTSAPGAFPSGDGPAGGDFRFRINVLPGDANRSGGSVVGSDVTLVRNAQNATPGAAGSLYTVFKDVNGTGSILGSDVTAVRNRQGFRLPSNEPATTSAARTASGARKVSAGSGGLSSTRDEDREDDLLASVLKAAGIL